MVRDHRERNTCFTSITFEAFSQRLTRSRNVNRWAVTFSYSIPSRKMRRDTTGNTLVTRNQKAKASAAPKRISAMMPTFFEPVMEATAATRVARMEPELSWLSTLASTPRVRVRMGLPLLSLGDLLLLDLLGHLLARLGVPLSDGPEHGPPGHVPHGGLYGVGPVPVPVVPDLLGGILVGLGLRKSQRAPELHPQKGGDEAGHHKDAVVPL